MNDKSLSWVFGKHLYYRRRLDVIIGIYHGPELEFDDNKHCTGTIYTIVRYSNLPEDLLYWQNPTI